MALRIGGGMPQIDAASNPAVMPEDEPIDAPALPDEAMELAPSEPGSVVEWLQEAIDLCNQYQCPEELAYALEQALVHLIGPSAVGATEPAMPPAEAPAEGQEEAPLPEEDEDV